MERCLVGLVVVGVVAGCGLPVPFGASRTVSVDVPLGPVDPACTAAAGNADVDGRSFSFAHHVDASGACVLSTTGSGPLLDLASVRAQAGSAANGSTIDGVSIDVSDVALQNGDAPLASRSIDASLDVLGQPRVVVVHDADATTHVSDALVAALDDVWQKSAPITGQATATASIDPGVVVADPKLHLVLNIHVRGTASLGR